MGDSSPRHERIRAFGKPTQEHCCALSNATCCSAEGDRARIANAQGRGALAALQVAEVAAAQCARAATRQGLPCRWDTPSWKLLEHQAELAQRVQTLIGGPGIAAQRGREDACRREGGLGSAEPSVSSRTKDDAHSGAMQRTKFHYVERTAVHGKSSTVHPASFREPIHGRCEAPRRKASAPLHQQLREWAAPVREQLPFLFRFAQVKGYSPPPSREDGARQIQVHGVGRVQSEARARRGLAQPSRAGCLPCNGERIQHLTPTQQFERSLWITFGSCFTHVHGS